MNRSSAPVWGPQSGFSLIELLVVIAISSLLMGLGAFAARQFWFQRALTAGQDRITTQLRALQQQVISEGISGRSHGAWFDPGGSQWGTVTYQATVSPPCRSTGSYEFDAGVEVDSVTVSTIAADVNFASPTDVGAICRNNLGLDPTSQADVQFVWFLSRGVATETTGNHIQITQPRRDDRVEQVRVFGLTGRAEKI